MDAFPGGNVAVAMSGGVDSSVTAALLKEQGARVQGVFMALAQPDLAEQIRRVRAVADILAIPLTVVDLAVPFRQEVLAYFAESYRAGRTPNPCVVCNRRIKFGRLLDFVRHELGADLLATGHYARIAGAPDTGYRLLGGVDPAKDQSYFLCRLGQGALGHLCFPLGGRCKEEVYGLAAGFGLDFRQRQESQDVCFLKGVSVAEFLAGHGQALEPGPVLTTDGREIGRHSGLASFTIGQRRGLGLPDATPWYVVGLEPDRRAVIVGKEAELFQERLLVRDLVWTSGRPPAFPCSCAVKIRYRHKAAAAEIILREQGRALVVFQEPQRAITPGQFAVFYHEEMVVGSGEIEGCAWAGAGERVLNP